MGNELMDTYVTVKDIALGRSHGRNFDFFVHDGDNF